MYYANFMLNIVKYKSNVHINYEYESDGILQIIYSVKNGIIYLLVENEIRL